MFLLKKIELSHVLFFIFTALAIFMLSRVEAIYYFGKFVSNDLIGIATFISLFALVTIIAPLTALPLVSPASAIFGPFLTALYSIAGWTSGAAVAFLIARYLWRPVLSFFVSVNRIEQYELRFSNRIKFLGLILLRIVMPVDLLSYAIGLFSTMPFTTYLLATVLGISPFAFIFAYAGNAIVLRQYTTLAILSMASLLIVGLIYYIYKKYFEKIRNNAEKNQ
jgi:uncharacterized membrane protein YdjX (TVP38/TMEM64 family)